MFVELGCFVLMLSVHETMCIKIPARLSLYDVRLLSMFFVCLYVHVFTVWIDCKTSYLSYFGEGSRDREKSQLKFLS